jgi:hypothetical protein
MKLFGVSLYTFRLVSAIASSATLLIVTYFAHALSRSYVVALLAAMFLAFTTPFSGLHAVNRNLQFLLSQNSSLITGDVEAHPIIYSLKHVIFPHDSISA